MVKILEVCNLTQYNFKNINISFEKGMFYSIVGSNNSGKTTLFRILSGFYPTCDVITCNDVCLRKGNEYSFLKNIGVVGKVNYDSFLCQTVLEEINYPLDNLNYDKKKRDKIIDEVSGLLKLKNILSKKISVLSYFEKQKLLFALALLHSPKVLLIDDALLYLKEEEKRFILSILEMLIKKYQVTIIYFTNHLSDVLISDRLFILSNYQILKETTINEIMENNQIFQDNNIDIPFIFDLSNKLQMYNLISKNYINMEELVNDLWP